MNLNIVHNGGMDCVVDGLRSAAEHRHCFRSLTLDERCKLIYYPKYAFMLVTLRQNQISDKIDMAMELLCSIRPY